MADSRKVLSEEWFQDRFGDLPPEVAPGFDTSHCADDEFLDRLVNRRKKPSLFDSQTSHVLNCPHCMRKAILMRKKAADKRAVALKRVWAPALAGCILLLGITLWVQRERGYQQSLVAVQQTVDLSSYGTYRGGGFHPQETISLPASVVTASIVLPRLSDPGSYLVTVDRNRESSDHVAQASAATVSQQNQQVLSVKLDLHAVRPGMYFLATTLERDGTTYYYPLEVVRRP